MSSVYDEAERHLDRLPGDLPHKAAATHIGLFFAWAATRDLVSEVHATEHPEAFDKLTRRWYTGRDYLLEARAGRLSTEDLNARGRAFADAYYGEYLRDYDAALAERHPTRYHVRDDWHSYARLESVLDERLHAFEAAVPAPVPGRSAPEAIASGAALPEAAPAFVTLPPPDITPEKRPVRAPPPLPPRPPPPLPPRAVQAPPPLPSKHAARPAPKKAGSAGKWWLLGILLLFVGVKAVGALIRTTMDGGLPGTFGREWIETHQRTQEQRAERIRRHIEAQLEADQIRKARWAPVSEEQTEAAAALGWPVKIENALGMRFVFIPAGGFVMGSPAWEEGRDEDEDLHNVELTDPFYMLTTEVSAALFSRFHEHAQPSAAASAARGGKRPVTGVAYEQATAFCRWLEQRDPERTYALPTEAQWEYACRAGSSEAFFWGSDPELASSFGRMGAARFALPAEAEGGLEGLAVRSGSLALVGAYGANPWGLYDMAGNAAEWCADWYGAYDEAHLNDPRGPALGARRVLRGGSAASALAAARCAARASEAPAQPGPFTGFRVVCRPRP
jgi:sulfatase modifying factor 1